MCPIPFATLPSTSHACQNSFLQNGQVVNKSCEHRKPRIALCLSYWGVGMLWWQVGIAISYKIGLLRYADLITDESRACPNKGVSFTACCPRQPADAFGRGQTASS